MTFIDLMALSCRLARAGKAVVMVSSEFGRTPKVNKDAGRDHWPKVFSVVVPGGAFKRGSIFGSSNATAAEPDSEPIEPTDLFATVYQQLGIDIDRACPRTENRHYPFGAEPKAHHLSSGRAAAAEASILRSSVSSPRTGFHSTAQFRSWRRPRSVPGDPWRA